jgi:uncharacterized repeat protein (TIGR01451 family)
MPFIACILLAAGGISLPGATASSTTLAATPNPSLLGHAVTLAAIVSPSSATGNVTFYDGTAIIGIAKLTNGTATLTTNQLPAGTQSLKALYSGDLATSPGASGPLPETITTVLEGGFLAAVNYTGGLFPIAVAVADLNGDGLADLISVNLSGNSVSILLGNGDGTFQTPANYTVGTNPRAVAVADFNGDGKPDLAVANENSGGTGSISILLGNGDGTFQTAVNYPVGAAPRSLVAGDFNGDGKADLAVANFAGGTIGILLGKGDGTLDAAVSYPAGASLQSIAAGDLNGDGKTDLVVANSGIATSGSVTGAGGLSVLLGNGDGTFRTAVSYTVGTNPVAIAVADLNGDGKTDLAVADLNSNDVSILLGNGDGTFLGALKTAAGAQPTSLVVGDFNGDGKLDVAVANQSSATVTVLIGNANGTFQSGVATSVGSTPSSLAIGEFNGDGRADLVTANLTGAGLSVLLGRVSISSVALSSSLNPATYGQSTTLTATVTPSTATGRVAFYDGVTVLATGILSAGQATFQTRLLASGPHSITAWYSGNSTLPAGTSAILPQTINAVPGSGFKAAVNYSPGGADAHRVVTADFNSDGRTDIAVLNRSGNSVGILLGNGDGTLQSALTYSTGSTPLAIVVGDFNGDGIPDLATANSGSGNVSILLGIGNGTFRAAVNYAAGSSVWSLTAADFNGDGYQDLAVTNNVTNNAVIGTVSILLSNGDGTFRNSISSPAGTSPDSIVAADFNADGKADLAIGGAAGALTILLGNGDGTFATPALSTLGSSVVAVDAAAGDFNGDGTIDLVFADGNAGLLVALGNGDGTFQAAIAYALATHPSAVTTGDFNGDGKLDIAAAGGAVNVLFGNGDDTFQTAVTWAAGAAPAALATADLNGDGRADLLAVGGAAVSVLLSQTPPAATVTLASSLNPSNFGQIVTLTATLSPSLATGKVTFYDGAIILGITTLAGGQATLPTNVLAAGAHALRAYYAGSSAALPATSALFTVTVAPLSQTGFQSPRIIGAGTSVAAGNQSIVYADFNGDGQTDLAVINTSTQSITIVLNRGNGAFSSPLNYSTGSAPTALVAADLNGDGFVDLAVSSAANGTVSVLLGNGDGTFQAAVPWGSFNSPGALAVADINGDGKPDLLVATAGSLAALIGNGDGTFGTAVLCAVCGGSATIAVGDLNGDGKADLILTASDGVSLNVLIGNGDGTFRAPVAYHAHITPVSIVVADFNGDGKADVAAVNATSGDVSVLTGNGNGTLQPAVNYAAVASPIAMAAGDFNGDGLPDLAIVGASANTIVYLMGNGNGTFQAPSANTLPGSPVALVTGDINGDGRDDIALFAGSTGVILLWGKAPAGTTATAAVLTSSANPSNYSQSVVITLTVSPSLAVGNVTFYDGATILGRAPLTAGKASIATALLPPGTRTLRAYYSGDSTYAAATATLTQVVNPLAQNGYRVAPALAAPLGANAMASGDFNGDGKPDLVVSGPNGLAVFLDSGGGTFGAPVTYPFINAGPVAVGDFNGDGYMDIAVASTVGSTGTIFLGTGHGTFQQAASQQATGIIGDAKALLVADVNGDGNADLVVVGNPNVTLLLGNGDGTFALPLSFPVGNGPLSAVAAHFNGDGKVDLAVADSGGNSDGTNISLLLGNGDGTFRPATTLDAGTLFSSLAYSITAGDFNLDGKTDLAVTTFDSSRGTGTMSVLRGNGDGTFQAAVNNATTAITSSIATLDFNGDGKPDLAIINAAAASVILYPGNGDGTFQSPVNYPAGRNPAAIVAADFNGDGRVDLAVANSFDKTVGILIATAAASVTVTTSQNPASYNQSVTLTGVVSPTTATGKVTFYDGAGILGTRTLSSGQAQLSTRQIPAGNRAIRAIYSGDSTYSTSVSPALVQTVAPLPQNELVLLGNVAAGKGPQSMAPGDFNGDGRLDLAVVSNGDNTLRILLGNGDGTLRPGIGYATDSGPASVAAADLDGDGKLDLIVANAVSNTVSIFPGNGDGTIRAGADYTTSGAPIAIAVADFNGDSRPDLVLANAGGSLDVFLGNGDGTFQSKTTFAAGAGLRHVAVADLNGDGIPDLIAANSTDGTISVFIGKTGGAFAPAVNYAAGASPQFAAVGDFNGDGKPDVAVAIQGGVVVLRGNGDGTFQPVASYSTGNAPAAIVIGDFNGDSRPDLAVADKLDNNVSILTGNGDGTFLAAGSWPSGRAPVFMSAADFNGDGLIDVAIGNSNDNNVTILLGRPPGADLATSLSHSGLFSSGQGGFAYTILVANTGNAPSSGTVTVTDTPPAGVTITAMAGTGWTCNAATATCSRADTLNIAASYPAITVTVSIASGAAGTVVNSASVLGGGGFEFVNNAAADPTTISNVGQTPQTISFPTPAVHNGSASFTVNATSTSGLTVALASNTPQVCLVSAVTISPVAPGTCSLTASQAGDLTYAAANAITHTFAIVPAGLAATVTLATSANPLAFGHALVLTATVIPAAATGKVTFYDGADILGTSAMSSGRATLTTSLLGSGSRSLKVIYSGDLSYPALVSTPVGQTVVAAAASGFAAAVSYAAGIGASSVAVADFNGDGKPDLAVSNVAAGTIGILRGNGDGTFLSALYVSTTLPAFVITGDFNGDGYPDIAFASNNSTANTSSVAVLFGRGDGTFIAGPGISVSAPVAGLAVADFNNDGIADIAVSATSGAVGVLLGNGDGRFSAAVVSTFAGAGPLAIGDFNGDGIADIAVITGGGVAILLGNGDGTLRAPLLLAANGTAITVGDFNNDGTADLAVATTGRLAVLQGNGDGTFQSPVYYTVGNGPHALVAADINGDGIPDLAIIDNVDHNLSVLRGNGDGTFQSRLTYSLRAAPQTMVMADFNGDSELDIAALDSSTNGVTLALGQAAFPNLTIAKSHSGAFAAGQTGATYTLAVSNIGQGATVGTVSVNDLLPAGLTATAMTGPGWICALSSLTCVRADVLAGGAGYPGITVTVDVSNSAPASVTNVASVSGGGDTVSSNKIASDTTIITTSVSGAKQDQTVTFAAISAQTLGSAPVALVATATSGLAVSFTGLNSVVCTVSGSFATLVAPGTCAISATQAGNASYNPAAPAIQVFTINATGGGGTGGGGGGGSGGGGSGGGTGGAALSTRPTALIFTVAGAAPAPLAINILSALQETYSVSITTKTGGSWLGASPLAGSLSADKTLTVTADATGLGVGTYAGSIKVVSDDTAATATVPVTMYVVSSLTGGLTASPENLAFTYMQGDPNLPAAQAILITSSVIPAAFSAKATTVDGGSWLVLTSSSGSVPGAVFVSINAAGLLPGAFRGAVNVTGPNGSSVSVPVAVNITKAAAQPSVLAVSPPAQRFVLSQTDRPASGQIRVTNAGTGTLQFTAQATTDQGNWLVLTSDAGSATPSNPVAIGFSLDPSRLNSGLYSGHITISQTGTTNATVVAVTVAVSQTPASIATSQSGLSFTAQAGGPQPPARTVGIANTGTGYLEWTARPQGTGGAANWFSVSPLSGTSLGGGPGAPVSISVDQTGLAPGQYYGAVNIASVTARNSPQTISVVLNVAESTSSGGGVALSSGGVVLSTAKPQAQISLFNASPVPTTFTSSISAGASWLSMTPPSGALSSGQNVLTIAADFSSLSAGVETGAITVSFADGSSAVVEVVAIANSPGPSSRTVHVNSFGSCMGGAAGSLVAVFDQPLGQEALQVGVPQLVEAQLFDDCGNVLTAAAGGTAQVTFSNGDPALTLNDIGSGIWQGTWTPATAGPQVNIQLAATEQSLVLNPFINPDVTAAVQPAGSMTAARPGGVVNAAASGQAIPQIVTPGSYVAIYGAGLSGNGSASAATIPLPNVLAGTELLLGGLPMPLSYAGPGQVNALVPQSLNANATYQLVVWRGSTESVPVPIMVAALQPGIFTLDASGSGQGIVEIAGTTLLAGPQGSGMAPARRGTDYLTIFCTGLGPVSGPNGEPAPADGSAAPTTFLYQTTGKVTATVGGINAPVTFAGLTPTLVSLYQVNVQVPANTPSGKAVPVVITVTDPHSGATASSNTVTVALQ